MSGIKKKTPLAGACRVVGIAAIAVALAGGVAVAADGGGRPATLDEQLLDDLDEQLLDDLGEQLLDDLDEQLLDDLGGGRLDDLDRALFGPSEEPARASDSGGETGEELEDRLRRELGEAAISEDENPLLGVARTMREVEGRIAEEDSGLTTRGLQEQIVADLDALIERARKKCQGSGQCNSSQANAGSQPKPGTAGATNNPAATSTPRDASGEPAAADEEPAQTLMRRLWDVALPLQQRQQLLQSPFDEFLPKYEQMIEEYFRRLAEGEEGGM